MTTRGGATDPPGTIADGGPEGVVRALADASREGVLVTDASGRVAYVNAIAEQLLRRPKDTLIGMVGWRLFETHQREKVREVFTRGLSSPGRPWTTDVDVGDGIGGSLPITLTVTNYEPPPSAQTVVVRLREATPDARAIQREQELEAELRQAQKMMAVGRMTAGIAHDFNNILTVISATADLIGAAIGPENEAAQEDLRALREATASGAAMVGKLMGFSRSAPVCPVPTDVGVLLERMKPLLQLLLPDEIGLDLVIPQHQRALCDASAIEQMVMNLVTNARDALGDGGRIRVVVDGHVVEESSPSRPQWLAPGPFVRISVHDNGTGMDEAVLSRVLEPFFTTKAPGAGTGLGLAMVYGLAKQQGGFVHIVSEVGQGTTAHIYLPKALR